MDFFFFCLLACFWGGFVRFFFCPACVHTIRCEQRRHKNIHRQNVDASVVKYIEVIQCMCVLCVYGVLSLVLQYLFHFNPDK